MAAGNEYDVFMSYSRDQQDHDVTVRLQDELQRFTRPWYRPRARTLRVFRDQTNLQASPDLWGTIEQAMSSSQWLLLVASPRSAQSAGVRRELTWWREQRGTADICIALTDGELRWDEAANDFDWPATTAISREALGHAFETEPAWIDLRPVAVADRADRTRLLRLFTRSPADPRMQEATASLIAEIKKVPKDTLIGEHIRRGRQTRRAVTSALSTLTILLAAAIVAALLAVSQRDQAVHQATVSEAGQLAAISETLTGSHLDLAQLFAAEAYHMYQDPQTRAALFGAVTADPHLVRYLPATGTISAVATSGDGHTAVAGTAGGDVLRWNLTNFRRSVVATLPGPISSVAVSADGNTIAAVDGRDALVWVRGAGIRRVPVPARWTTVADAVSPSGQYAVFSLGNPAVGASLLNPDGTPWLLLIDEQTGHSVLVPADLYYPGESLSFDGETQLVALASRGGWERLAVPSLTKLLASSADFAAHDHAQAMSATGAYISFTNGGTPLNVWNTLTTPTPYYGQRGAWEVGDTPSALAISADGSVAADADSGTIYVSHITSFKDASSSTLLTLAGNTTINQNTLTFVGQGDSELLSASGSFITLWDLNQYSRISTAASVSLPPDCLECVGPGIAVSPHANQAVIDAGSGATILVDLPPLSAHEQQLPQDNAAGGTYGPAVWSSDGQEFSILTPGDSSGEIWDAANGLTFMRNWADRQSASQAFDSSSNPPASLMPTANGKYLVEIDEAGNVVVRDSVTGAVKRALAGPFKSPYLADIFSSNQAAVDPAANYAALMVQLPSRAHTYIIDIKTGDKFPVPGGPVTGVAYAGEQLLIQRSDGTLEVRTADGRRLIRSFAGDADAVAGPVVGGSGLAVEANANGSAPVFDLTGGEEIGSLTLPAGLLVPTSIAFSPDGTELISATEGRGTSSDIGEVTKWSFSPSVWSDVACASAGHTLTSEEWQEYVGTGGPGMPSQMACQS